jgi:hypothetical protein
MRDHLERRPENREIYHDRTPPMPAYAPTEDTDNPHSTTLRREHEHETAEPAADTVRDDDTTP